MKKLLVSFVFLFSTVSLAADLDCTQIYDLMGGFVSNHVVQKKLDATLESRAVDQYVKRLDPLKQYFLESDIKDIKSSLTGVFKKLQDHDCAAIEAAEDLYKKRVKERVAFVKKIVGPKYVFDANAELNLDPDQRKWASTQAELDAFLTKFIHFQVSNYLVSDMKLPEAKKQLIHRYGLLEKRADESKRTDLYALFLDSFASAMDPHSSYLSKDTLEDFEISMRLSLEGIGASLSSQDGYTVVEELIPGGAAEKSGEIQPKDKIIGVGQGKEGAFEPVIDMPLREVVQKIRGKKGTVVKLNVLREGKGGKGPRRFEVTLNRDKINLKEEAAKMEIVPHKVGTKTLKFAVIELPSFYMDFDQPRTKSCSQDLKALVKEAVTKGVDGIMLDFSKNPGGSLSEAVAVAGLFIQRGNVVATKDFRERIETLDDRDPSIDYKGPLVVLTSRLSASASEIVAGALQDYKRAVIVGGDHTFGKGTVQSVQKLRDGLGAVKVTVGMFYIPGGNSTQHRGVISDVSLPSEFSTKELGEKSLDYSLPPTTIPPFLSPEANENPDYAFKPVTNELITTLKSKSDARVKESKEFAKITQELADNERKKGIVKIAELMKKSKSEGKDEKAKKNKRIKGLSPEYLKQPQIKESLNVLADLIMTENSIPAAESVNLAGKRGEKTDGKKSD